MTADNVINLNLMRELRDLREGSRAADRIIGNYARLFAADLLPITGMLAASQTALRIVTTLWAQAEELLRATDGVGAEIVATIRQSAKDAARYHGFLIGLQRQEASLAASS